MNVTDVQMKALVDLEQAISMVCFANWAQNCVAVQKAFGNMLDAFDIDRLIHTGLKG